MMTPPSTTLVNATPFDAVYLDGQTERVMLARLTIRQIYTFTQLLAGEKVPELVGLCTGRPPEWLDTLEDTSFAGLSQKCIALNFPRAVAMSKSDPVIALRTMPFMQGMQTIAILTGLDLVGLAAGLKSKPESDGPAPSGSAAETGSESSTSPPVDSTPSSPPATA